MAGIRRFYEIWTPDEDATLLDETLTKDEAFAAASGYARLQKSGFVMVVSSDTGQVWDVA